MLLCGLVISSTLCSSTFLVFACFGHMADSADLQEGLQLSSVVVCSVDMSSLHPECLMVTVEREVHCYVVSPTSSPGASSPLHSTSSGSGATPFPRRVCVSSVFLLCFCRRVLVGIRHDPHTVCILYCGGVCHVNSQCQECSSWSSRLVLRVFKYQQTL